MHMSINHKKHTHLDVVLGKTSPFAITEAYKTMRTNLSFALADAKNKRVVITSSLPNEGKSTTATNIAITLAQTGKRTLLIDADMRKPTQYKIFRLTKGNGLSSLLGGFTKPENTIVNDVRENLDLITSGPIPPNPTELLSSSKMKDLLEELNKTYEYIILDTPPINIVSDALALADVCAGVVLVIRQNQTKHETLQKAIKSLEFAEMKILGAVVTHAGNERKSRYYRYMKYKSYKE